MKVIAEIDELREWNRQASNRRRILVPTMGALHAGHLSLCDIARKEAGTDGNVVATIFVNPTQFGPNEDLDAYPRPLEEDLTKCEARGVDLVFTPDASTIYAEDGSVLVDENKLSSLLCGASRPSHFRGVFTVVTKLFNLTQPDAAVFGEKDFQQLAIIRRLVRDLNFPIEIIAGPTIREPDGLAMSSRNAYLSEEERAQAPVIFESLSAAISGISDGSLATPELARKFARGKIETTELAGIDYLEIFHSDTLELLVGEFTDTKNIRIAAAVFFGKTRLIDNVGIFC